MISSKRLQFVVQKHDASHLHYDLRLEMGGVMVSWAVPKGLSYDPKVKRLAVRVDDHTMKYASFEGVIPKGSYGAGKVLIWDRGTYMVEHRVGKIGNDKVAKGMLAKGSIRFTLEGTKLKGAWHLLRLKESKNWMLIKLPSPDNRVPDLDERSVVSGKLIEDIN